jgi:hypothetical protein
MLAAALQMRAFLRHLESPVIGAVADAAVVRAGGDASGTGAAAFALFGYLIFIDNYIFLDNTFCPM